VLTAAVVEKAWRAVCRNRGSEAPGIDGVTRQRVIDRIGVDTFIHGIARSLAAGSHQFSTPRAVYIPKPSGGTRRISVLTLRDRVVLMALKLVLETIFEPLFLPSSYGFRPALGPHAAVRAVIGSLTNMNAPVYVATADIAGFFDGVDHELLLGEVSAHVQDPGILALLQRSLALSPTAGIGVPQGSPLSPLLANILLHRLDEQFTPTCDESHRRQDAPRIFYARYADDMTVLVSGRPEDAEDVLGQMRAHLANLRLELAEDKTHIQRVEEGFEMLGFFIKKTADRVDVRPSSRAVDRLKGRLVELARQIPLGVDAGKMRRQIAAITDGFDRYFDI